MRRLSSLVAAALVVLGGGVVVGVAALPAHADTQICSQFGSTTIQSGKYVVMNNVWGDSTTQCINVTNTGFAITSAAHNLSGGAPGAYPAVYAGCHYANCSTGSGLPLQVSDSRFATIATSVSMSYPNNNSVYDASYDIWFDPTPRTDGQNTGAELMVWINHTGSVQPAGSKVGTASIAGANWDVWLGRSSWNIVSYVRQSTVSSINFNVASFYRDMVNRGYAQNSWYITSVQAGFEPWVNGTGLAVNNFSYSIGSSGGTSGPPASSSPTSGGTGGASCRVTYTKSEWQGGFTGNVTVANTGTSTINGWTLAFPFPGDQHITSAWNATVSQNGNSVSAANVGYNGTIAPGGNTSFGFQGTWASNDSNPTAFRLNGTACSTG